MTRTELLVRVVCGGAIGYAAAKLLPPPVMAAAAGVMMIWAWISLRQIKRREKEVQEILRQVQRLRE
jgi:hypothetical protein